MTKILTRYAFIIILLAPAGLIAQDMAGSATEDAFGRQTVNISQWEASANIRPADNYYVNTTDIDKNKKVSENKEVSDKMLASKPLVIKADIKQTLYKNTTAHTAKQDISHQITDISQIKNIAPIK